MKEYNDYSRPMICVLVFLVAQVSNDNCINCAHNTARDIVKIQDKHPLAAGRAKVDWRRFDMTFIYQSK